MLGFHKMSATAVFEMKNRYAASLNEKTANPESGLMQEEAVAYGDTSNDLSDMHRLGKKQEFQVPFLAQSLCIFAY